MWTLLLALTAHGGEFTVLEPGLELARLDSPRKSSIGDSVITVLRIDPEHWDLEVVAASKIAPGESKTAKAWGEQTGMIATINAGMYEMDHSTATFWMKVGEHVNSTRWQTKAGSLMVLDGSGPDKIIDLRCEDGDAAKKAYPTQVQSYRMLNCSGEPAWKPSKRIWSHASIGMDGSGRILFIHARSPWSTHDFAKILLELPLDLKRLQYAEGGPEASLYVKEGDLELFGSFETGFVENDKNSRAWPIPNVIGVKAK